MKIVTLRPLLLLMASTVGLAACSEGTDGGYQAWADKVATIPLTPDDSEQIPSVVTAVLAPAEQDEQKRPSPALRVELMSPHQLWDARNGPLKIPTIEVAEGTATPVPVAMQIDTTPPVAATPPAPVPPAKSAAPTDTGSRTVQLGAFSTASSAHTAWERLSRGPHGGDLRGLDPQFEPAVVNGRNMVRLRVTASADRAQTLCQTVASADPWCSRPTVTVTPSTVFH